MWCSKQYRNQNRVGVIMDEQTVEDVVEVYKKNDMIIRVKIVYGKDFQRHKCLANKSGN